MSSQDLHKSLLRPAVLQILRAAGFNYARPAVIDTVTDLAARYLVLLASSTAQNAFNTHGDSVATVQDVRLALLDVGALRPQLSVLEEKARGVEEINGDVVPFEDMRGVDEFVKWAKGAANKEIRRIAGLEAGSEIGDVAAALDEQEDYVTALKTKHSKTGEEARYQGTVLGKESDVQIVSIVGGPVSSLSEWGRQNKSRAASHRGAGATLASSTISSAPLTPMEGDNLNS